MKCVCPMGGDRTCPNDCPVATWENLSPTDRKAQRKAIAKAMFGRGMTPERIAKEQKSGLATVYRDLDISHDDKCQGKDTLGRKKSGGRPKGSKNKKPADPVRVNATKEEFEEFKRVAAEAGATAADKLGEIVRGAEIELAQLSLSAQQKLETAIRQHKRKLDLEFEERVQKEYQDRLNEFLPEYHKKLADAEAVIKAREGVMSRRQYRKIWACLQPDRGASMEMLTEAFIAFEKLEPVLVNEIEAPTSKLAFPRTYAEMMELRQKTSEARKAKRGNGQVSRRV